MDVISSGTLMISAILHGLFIIVTTPLPSSVIETLKRMKPTILSIEQLVAHKLTIISGDGQAIRVDKVERKVEGVKAKTLSEKANLSLILGTFTA